MVALMRRGEIWVARLNPNQGAEVGKLRPVVILQADPITRAGLATVVVVPLTTQDRCGARALRVPIRARDRLLCDSFAMADQPRSLDRSRLGDGPLTTLRREELAELERALLGVLGIGLA
jgi:mRNA interferase MazF